MKLNVNLLSLVIGLTLGTSIAQADDLDIYLSTPTESSKVPPNVLFVLDVSATMGFKLYDLQCDPFFLDDGETLDPLCSDDTLDMNVTRLDTLRSVMGDIFYDAAFADVNAAVMKFSSWGGGTPEPIVVSEFVNIGAEKAALKNAVNTMDTGAGTPTVNALVSAVNWFEGDFVEHHCTFSSCTVPAPEVSPIAGDRWCAPNHIVLLTDGEPLGNGLVSQAKKALYLEEEKDPIEYPPGNLCERPDPFLKDGGDGVCSQEIAAYANATDFAPDIEEKQNIITHTIAFGLDKDDDQLRAYLGNIAEKGGGQYFPATDAESLSFAFKSIVDQAVQEPIPYTYNAPAIPFNQENTAFSGEEIYVPVYAPKLERFWKGNLKKYRLTTDESGKIKLEDSSGKDVIDDHFQFVDSTDFWGTSLDGADPLSGGAAAQRSGERNLYTYLGDEEKRALTDDSNRVSATNPLITKDMIGEASDAERTASLQWVSWEDGLTHPMGAPLHTAPTVVTYEQGQDLILLPTSEGVLEAIDAKTGREVWAFMPKELLRDISIIKNNAEANRPHYGLDGGLTVYTLGNKRFAVFGMRRGGKHYFALDISNREAPKFAWQIDATGRFSQLGQTWSKPLFMRMHLGGTDKNVLVFSGGYDPDQDVNFPESSRSNDDEGHAIYIVDPENNGQALMVISSETTADLVIPDMKNAIAGDVLPVDINGNSVVDRLYAADTGGRIIRIDLPDAKFADKTPTGGIIADVNAGGIGYQRFFNTPEVGYFSKAGLQYLAVLIGSGFRPEPADNSVTDRFYMIKDKAVWKAPKNADGEVDYTQVRAYDKNIANGELYNASANDIQNGTQEKIDDAKKEFYDTSSQGWFIDFAGSEKSFSRARLHNYAILFTTYSGTKTARTEICVASETSGTSSFYALNLIDATAATQFGFDERSQTLNIPGLPPGATLIFTGDDVRTTVGLEEVGNFPDIFRGIYWEEVINGMPTSDK